MPDTSATDHSTPVAPIVHYADDSEGVTFIDNLTLAPMPSLCRTGNEDHYMTFSPDDVTCPQCLAIFAGAE